MGRDIIHIQRSGSLRNVDMGVRQLSKMPYGRLVPTQNGNMRKLVRHVCTRNKSDWLESRNLPNLRNGFRDMGEISEDRFSFRRPHGGYVQMYILRAASV